MSDPGGWRTPKGREHEKKISIRGRGWSPTIRGGRGPIGRGTGPIGRGRGDSVLPKMQSLKEYLYGSNEASTSKQNPEEESVKPPTPNKAPVDLMEPLLKEGMQ